MARLSLLHSNCSHVPHCYAMSDEEAVGPSQQPAGDGANPETQTKLPNLSRKKLKKLHDKEKAKGVVYLSRIPPHLVRDGWCMQLWRRPGASCALNVAASLPAAEAAKAAPAAAAVCGDWQGVPGARGCAACRCAACDGVTLLAKAACTDGGPPNDTCCAAHKRSAVMLEGSAFSAPCCCRR